MNKPMTHTKAGSVNASVQSIESFLKLSIADASGLEAPNSQSVSELAYHEMESVPVRQVDLLEQLDRNIQSLSDLRHRLKFMNREIRYLTGR